MENNKESLFWNGLIENLKKYAYFMLVAACIAGALFYVYVQKSAQQFTAEAVIEYASEDGNAPDGTKIDVSEITSSEIIAAACKDLDLAEANIDEIRSSITIKEIVDEEEEAMYLSKLDHGEEYEELADELEELRSRIADLNGDLNDFIRRVVDLRDRHPEA